MMDILLRELDVLVIDCQATGPNPEKGHLLEIGWGITGSVVKGTPSVRNEETHFVRLPEPGLLPRQVSAVTGISSEDLSDASPPCEMWERLRDTVRKITSATGPEKPIAVIHYSRYEKPFLLDLQIRCEPGSELPFDIICSHELARRLLPGLPRKGIRAVAGYFGHSVPELRRAGSHITATAFIWQKLIKLIENEHGITSIVELREWLKSTEIPTGAKRHYPLDRSRRLDLPEQPGVYRMLRSSGDVLYVGKARSLRSRVGSYFQKRKHGAEHILEMLSQVHDVDVTVTGSAIEAALIETDEIKRLEPPYNRALREKHRTIVFGSGDLRNTNDRPDDSHTIGPLPSAVPLSALSAILDFLTGHREMSNPDHFCLALGMSPDYLPDEKCFIDGFAAFGKRRAGSLEGQPSPHSLLTLGRELWIERQKAIAEAAVKEEEEEDTVDKADEGGVEWTWTPEAVANVLESVIRHSVFLIRRSRWFCLLSESTLGWEKSGETGGEKNVLLFSNGAVSLSGVLENWEKIPTPPGTPKRYREKQQNFDLSTYDRMRVLTTEIRRLLSEKRDLRLKLGPTTVLGPEDLGRALWWV